MSPALNLVAGKRLSVGFVFETSGIIEDFILRELAVQVLSSAVVIAGPGGRFEGVVLSFDG